MRGGPISDESHHLTDCPIKVIKRKRTWLGEIAFRIVIIDENDLSDRLLVSLIFTGRYEIVTHERLNG